MVRLDEFSTWGGDPATPTQARTDLVHAALDELDGGHALEAVSPEVVALKVERLGGGSLSRPRALRARDSDRGCGRGLALLLALLLGVHFRLERKCHAAPGDAPGDGPAEEAGYVGHEKMRFGLARRGVGVSPCAALR